MGHERKLMMTLTGEVYQPIRVHYDLFDKSMALSAFSRLRCIDFDSSQNRWVWLYDAEAKRLKFKNSYFDIPKKKRPIILASIFFREEGQMFFDIRSHKRATQAIVFFDRYIKSKAAKVTDISIVNRLFDGSEGLPPLLDIYFNRDDLTRVNPEEALEEFKAIFKGSGTADKRELAFSLVEKKMKEPFPEIERFPAHFYEDGISGLETALEIRRTIAKQHWLGNTDYTFSDLIAKVFQ